MGIDSVALETILLAKKYCNKYDNLLTLGRQEIHLQHYKNTKYCENLFHELGFKTIDSVDASSYENASIIHNMNYPFYSSKKYDFIFDGGTFEHIFNSVQLCENIINSLNIGGIFCSITVNNNFSGHGFYQYSPEFFLSAFSKKYGMEILEIFLAQVDTPPNEWINVNSFCDGRNTTHFNNNKPVYIVTIAKKINNERLSLFNNPPSQYSYENFDWKAN